MTEEEHMNKTTECSVLPIGLTRLKNICLLPFCTYALCVMQFNLYIALMHAEVLLERGAGRCCKDVDCWPPLFWRSPSSRARTQTNRGMKPLEEATKDTTVLWLGLWCVPMMALVWQKGRASS